MSESSSSASASASAWASDSASAPSAASSAIASLSSSSSASTTSSPTDPSSSSTLLEQTSDTWFVFTAKYAKVSLEVRLAGDDTVGDLKATLFSLTDVPPDRQKLLGLSRGRLPPDDALIESLQFPPASTKAGRSEDGAQRVGITLVGTPVDATFRDPQKGGVGSGDLFNVNPESDIDYAVDPQAARRTKEKKVLPPSQNPKYLRKLEKCISRFSGFPVIHEPRPGLRGGLLVLDLDYTIADTKVLLDPLRLPSESARPGLHEFLTAVYPHYDICVWSQTSWVWLETKLTDLGMLQHPGYKVSFVLDRTAMFSVDSGERKHEVKALELIWRRFPGFYSPNNTLHVDDLSRNFAMNPLNGIKIKPYRNAPSFDTELVALQRFCLALAHPDVTDFQQALQGVHAKNGWKSTLLPSVDEALPITAGTATTTTAAAEGGAEGSGTGSGNAEGGTQEEGQVETVPSTPGPEIVMDGQEESGESKAAETTQEEGAESTEGSPS